MENNDSQIVGGEALFEAIRKVEGEQETFPSEREAFIFGNISRTEDSIREVQEKGAGEIQALELYAESLGLSKNEVAEVLASGGFFVKAQELGEKIRDACDNLRGRIQQIVTATSTALVIGMTPTPSLAEEAPVTPPSIEKITVPTYANLESTVFTDRNEKALVAVKNNQGKFEPVAMKEGSETSAYFPEKEIDKLLEAGIDVELAHTHPLYILKLNGDITEEMMERVRAGEQVANPAPPSVLDLIVAISYDHKASQAGRGSNVSNKIVESSGDWEYSVLKNTSFLDRGASFVRAMSELAEYSSRLDDAGIFESFTPEEKAYVEEIKKENYSDPRLLSDQISVRAARGEPLAMALVEKTNGAKKDVNGILQKISNEDNNVFYDFIQTSTAIQLGGSPEQLASRVKQLEGLARTLGLSLKYTPRIKVD